MTKIVEVVIFLSFSLRGEKCSLDTHTQCLVRLTGVLKFSHCGSVSLSRMGKLQENGVFRAELHALRGPASLKRHFDLGGKKKKKKKQLTSR